MTTLNIDLDALLSDEHNRKEVLAWMMASDVALDSLVELIAAGRSPEGSHPARLDALRLKLHKKLGDEYHAEAMRRVQEAEEKQEAAEHQLWAIEQRLKTARELLPKFEALHSLPHDPVVDGTICDACQFIEAIKGEGS